MAISEARHRANEKYNAKAYEEIKIRVPKGKKEVIQTVAKESQLKSVNAYINHAIDLLMGGGYGFQTENEDNNRASRVISHVALFSETEELEIEKILKEGQTVEEFIREAVLEKCARF